MGGYILKRLLLMIPTLFGIMLISFAIIQFAPGGPVERVLAQLQGTDVGATARIGGGSGGGEVGGGQAAGAGAAAEGGFKYRGAQGLDPEFIKKLEEQFGFDKPAHERFFLMLKSYAMFDFGQSYFRDVPVLQLIKEKLPVSISLGLWLTFVSYAISIPLGVAKAVRDGSRFDVWTSAVIIVGYAIPSFLFAVLLVVLFAGGSFWNIFPLRGLVSDNFADLSWWEKIIDYAWHLVLATHRTGSLVICNDDAADQELVPRRDQEAVRDDRAGQGPDRAPGAVWPCVPQRHADRDCRFSRRLHRGVLCGLAADRADLLARRAGPAGL
jgi:microcin C transport system permease protein